MIMYKINPVGLSGCIEKDFQALFETWIEEAEPGDKFEIEVIEMTESELESLPEFMGP